MIRGGGGWYDEKHKEINEVKVVIVFSRAMAPFLHNLKRQITLFKENQSRKDLFSTIEFFKDLYFRL